MPWQILLGAILLQVFDPRTRAAAGPSGTNRVVCILPIRQEIAPPLAYLVRRGVKQALEDHADLLVLDINTDGGQLDVTEQIIGILDQFKGEIAAYVDDRAFSAGTFIAVEAQKIYMAPGSVIGAAAPLLMTPGGGIAQMPETAEVKITSAVRALVRRTAEKNGYNTDVLEAMIDKKKRLEIDGKVLKKEGDILALTDREAQRKYGRPPKPLLSSGTVASLNELLVKLGYAGARVERIEPTGMETLAVWLNRISPILLLIGAVGVYLEIKMPGHLLPGAIGAGAFLLYFLGGYVAGLSGWEWALVFAAGVGLLVFEVFVAPGVVLPGFIGLGLILTALVMAMTDFYPGGPWLPQWRQLSLPLRNVALGAGGATAIILALTWWFPRSAWYRRVAPASASGEATSQRFEQEKAHWMGREGVALSALRPSGKAQFGDAILHVTTQGEMIERGARVRIIGQTSTGMIVEEILAQTPPAARS